MTGTRDALLREAAAAVELIERNSYVGIDTKAIVRAMYVDLARSALASTPSAESPLDVERLARALHADAESMESVPTDWEDCPDRAEHLEYAKFLADEYARLREPG